MKSASKPREKILAKNLHFSAGKMSKICCVFFEFYRKRVSFIPKQKIFLGKKKCSNEIHQMSFEKRFSKSPYQQVNNDGVTFFNGFNIAFILISANFIWSAPNFFGSFCKVKIVKFKPREVDICYKSHFLLTIKPSRRI